MCLNVTNCALPIKLDLKILWSIIILTNLHVQSIQERTGSSDGCKYGPVTHQIILVAGDQVEEAGRDLETAEGGR